MGVPVDMCFVADARTRGVAMSDVRSATGSAVDSAIGLAVGLVVGDTVVSASGVLTQLVPLSASSKPFTQPHMNVDESSLVGDRTMHKPLTGSQLLKPRLASQA